MLNQTLINLWTSLNSLNPLPSSHIPYFTYDESTNLMSLYVDKTAYNNTDPIATPNPIILSLNQLLLIKIQGFPLTSVNPSYLPSSSVFVTFSIMDGHDNSVTIGGVNYLVSTQENQNFDSIIDMLGLLFQTNLPVTQETTGDATNNPILTDFTLSGVTIKTYRDNLVYNAIVPYRQCGMINASPMIRFNLQVLRQNKDGTKVPQLLGPGQSASVKLMFFKKISDKYM
jgi:hypothetical protein